MDKEEFTRAVLEYESTLYRVAKSMLGSEADCADAALTLAAVAVSCRRAMAASMTSRRSPLAAAFSSRARRAAHCAAVLQRQAQTHW